MMKKKTFFHILFSALEYSSLTNLSILKCWSYQQLVEDRAEVILRGQTCTQVWGPQLDSGPSVCLTSEVSFPSARRVPAPLLSAAHSFTLAASPQRTASSPALYTLSETLCVRETATILGSQLIGNQGFWKLEELSNTIVGHVCIR